MISVSEAKALIFKSVKPLEPITVSLENAAGHNLAKDIYAICDIPAFRQSSMDGYALKFEDRNMPLQLIGEMAAGTGHSLVLSNGETGRIFTGAPLPEGADTVVMQEKIMVENGKITIHDNELKSGSNVRDQGAEIKSGELAMSAGTLLSPAAIGFLAGIGFSDLEVFPMPNISIIVTGTELRKPGLKLGFGQVYESNSFSISAALKQEGIDQIAIFNADDDLDIVTNVLKEALKIADVVLLAGGVSVGDYDFVIEASKRCGIDQIFHKVKQKPGKPLFFGIKEQKLIFGLPGNPSSVLSCYYNYVLPALKMLSQKKNSVKEIKAELTHDYCKPPGISHFLKGVYENGKATPLGAQESFRLSSFAQANCLINLDEQQEEYLAGDSVTVMLLPN